eukprot:349862-Chlamydomonas_euryale.AAC.4
MGCQLHTAMKFGSVPPQRHVLGAQGKECFGELQPTLMRSSMPSYAPASSGGERLRQRTLAKPPLLSVDTTPRNTIAGSPVASPAPSMRSIPERLTPPITTSSSAPHPEGPVPSPDSSV